MTTTRLSLLCRLDDPKDESSWSEFVQTYGPIIFRYALRFGLGAADAQDAMQETLVVVSQKIAGFRYDPGRGRFSSWLLKIAHHKILGITHRRRHDVGMGGSTVLRQLAEVPDSSPPPLTDVWEQQWEAQILNRCLKQVQEQVDPDTFDAFRRVALEGQATADVAAAMSIPVDKVYYAKSRVTKRLKELAAAWDKGDKIED